MTPLPPRKKYRRPHGRPPTPVGLEALQPRPMKPDEVASLVVRAQAAADAAKAAALDAANREKSGRWRARNAAVRP